MPSHNPTDRCRYRDPAGRRCRLPRKPTHPDLCPHHARLNLEGTFEDPKTLLAEVLGPEPEFDSAASINHTVGNLLTLLISRRLPARQVAVAGYLCQLLIQTLPHIERQERPTAADRHDFDFITHIPQPDYSKVISSKQIPEGDTQ